jgi:hypothetical protein
MTSFEGLKDLFIVLKVKHNPKKYWSDFIGWGIIQIMNDLLESIWKTINVASFLSINAKQITTINNTTWISMIICMLFKVENWFHY